LPRDEKNKELNIRAKAEWQVEGEKSTNYFCSLEKLQFTGITYPQIDSRKY
jgi:hypothetical protein